MNDTLQKVRDFFIHPGMLFEQIAAEKNLKQGICIWFAVSLLSYIPQLLLTSQLNDQQTAMQAAVGSLPPIMIVFSIVIGIVLFVIMGGVVHLSARLCGGKGEFKALMTCLLFMSLLSIIAIPVTILFNYLVLPGMMAAATLPAESFTSSVGPLFLAIIVFILAMSIWGIVLSILILRKCYMLSKLKATLAFFLPFVAFFGIIILMTIATRL